MRIAPVIERRKENIYFAINRQWYAEDNKLLTVEELTGRVCTRVRPKQRTVKCPSKDLYIDQVFEFFARYRKCKLLVGKFITVNIENANCLLSHFYTKCKSLSSHVYYHFTV